MTRQEWEEKAHEYENQQRAAEEEGNEYAAMAAESHKRACWANAPYGSEPEGETN
jgi:hypothetical protein